MIDPVLEHASNRQLNNMEATLKSSICGRISPEAELS